MAWTYGGWRRESGSTAQRAMLILHIEEVEAMLSGFRSQGAMGNTASRYELQSYIDGLQKRLEELDEDLDGSNDHPFVQARPIS